VTSATSLRFTKVRILSDIDSGGALPYWDEYFPGGGCLDGLNLYAYCHNNPVRYVDPTGHDVGAPGGSKGPKPG
jgi:hypothetical protein